MLFRKTGINRNIDWVTFSLYLGLVFLGWLMIYAVTFEGDTGSFLGSAAGKQLIWIFIAIGVMGLITVVDWKFWQTFAYPVFGVSLLLLIGVLFFGVTIKGARSWFAFGGFSIQPSEFAKLGACLAMSAYLSSYGADLRTFKSQIIALAIMLAPAGLILMQPDAGSALVFTSFLVVLYREGLTPAYYWIGFSLVTILLLGFLYDPMVIWTGMVALIVLGLSTQFTPRIYWSGGALLLVLIAAYVVYQGHVQEALIGMIVLFTGLAVYFFGKGKYRMVGSLTSILLVGGALAFVANYGFNNILQPHQQDRINVWLQPEKCDPRGSLYNVLQSKMAISSGGLQGKGFLQGTMTKLNYVPEQSTDFIFCTVGEEHGFIGSLVLIVMFVALLSRLVFLAERQRSNFSRIYIYSFAGILFIHVFVNIGMTLGLVPIIGIPLPFISKGGSSLLGFTIMLAVLLKLDSNRFNI